MRCRAGWVVLLASLNLFSWPALAGDPGVVQRGQFLSSYALARRGQNWRSAAAGLEVTFGGLAVRAGCDLLLATAGAPTPVHIDGRAHDACAPLHLRAGQVLELGRPDCGVRTYVAIRGGIDVRATDLLSGIGPARLGDGDRIPLGTPNGPIPGVDHVAQRSLPPVVELRVVPGPRADWFTAAARRTFGETTYAVSAHADRIGVRLTGPALERSRTEELLSEGLVEGAVQVPADGQPLIFLADHPVTGGYPVIAVVHPDDLPYAGQVRPGQSVRFRWQAPISVPQ